MLPALAAEGVGPISAIRRASTLLRSKWGESPAGEARFGLLGTLFCLQALLIFLAGLVITLWSGATAMGGLGPILMPERPSVAPLSGTGKSRAWRYRAAGLMTPHAKKLIHRQAPLPHPKEPFAVFR